MENLKRPTRVETDEDLLREQEVFLKKKEIPAAQIDTKNSEKSKLSLKDNPSQISPKEESCEEDGRKSSEMESTDFISDIKEREMSSIEPFVFQPAPFDPFEIEKVVNKSVKVSKFAAQRKAQSIFVQMLKSSDDQEDNKKQNDHDCHPLLIDGSGLTPNAQDSEAKLIHEENMNKLSTMSKEEILHHQEQLKNYLKPEILSFIKKKSLKKDEPPLSSNQPQNNASSSNFNSKTKDELPGEILRKEGKDSDALILEKVMSSESNAHVFQDQNKASSTCHEPKEDFEIPQEAKELIEGDSKGLWRNMNKIEKDKLEWMTDLPKPKPIDLKTGYTARFDFEGKLLAPEADVPTYQGLHHHGKEPEVPGYSLEELFLLSRSSMQSQRITALNTIAHILENNWCGMLDTCFDSPLLPLLLNAGIVPLLRWALDDTSLTSVAATITAIHSLLISKADEACLSQTFCWMNGHFVPQLEPQDLEEPNIVIEELTDADLIQLDVVKGFLRIDILPRFYYILKVMCPPPLVCKLIIEICARLAQHSPESARQVAEHPGLLELLFEKFLPLNWQFTDSNTLTDTVNYNCPMHSALKLMRILACSSKDLAIDVAEKFDLISIITFYMTIQTVDMTLPLQDVQLLAVETLRTWHTFLCYGLGSKVFLDLFPILLKQLDFCQSLNLNCDITKHLKDVDYATHIFKAFEAVAVIAAEQKDDKDASAAVNLVFRKALVCLKKWLWQFTQEYTSTPQMNLLAACMNFVVSYCRKSHEKLICEDWEPCSAAKEAFDKYLVPLIKSSCFQNLLENFRSYSLYLNADKNGNYRDGKTIVSLGSVLYGKDIVPNLKEGTPLPLLSAVLNYILLYKDFFHDIGNECLDHLFCLPICDYLKAVSARKLKSTCWFLKFEIFYIYQLIKLSTYSASVESSICHEIATSVLPAYTSSEESLIEDIFEKVIFNEALILKMSSTLQSLSCVERNDILSIASRLPVISQCYASCFFDTEAIQMSRSMLFRNTNLPTLFILSTPSALISKDWCFMPIFQLYQKNSQRKSENLTPEESLQVTSSLQWIYLCHILSLPVLNKIPASAEFYYICLVFLLDGDLFRDEKIKSLLGKCMSIILKQKILNLCKVNWNGIKNLEDLFRELLNQYESVSYGDEMFGNFLALPLQQYCHSEWKKLLLSEHSSMLRFFRVPLIKLFVPLEKYLDPIETDIGVLSEYFKVLVSGSLNHKICPLLYLMAVHHIHNFVFINADIHIKSQKYLLSNILRAKKDLQKNILLYLKADESTEWGFCMSEELSPENRTHLSNIMGISVDI